MTRIPDENRELMEQAIYLPMALTVFNRDLNTIQHTPFKLKQPYLHLIEETMKLIQKDLFFIKKEMKQQNMKVSELKRDEAFTLFLFVYKGYEEQHNYFNPRIRSKVQEVMEKYLLKKGI